MSTHGGPSLGKDRKPLTRADVEERLKQAGSSERLSLVGENLNSSDLSDMNLRSVNFQGADLNRANLTGADLSGADLSGANLSGANLSEANLSEASLIRADLTRANLIRANLTRAKLNGIYRIGTYVSARLLPPILTEADLSKADLSEAVLIRADLRKVKLVKAKLRRADLSGADLSGVDLSGVDLSGADLSGANLANVIVMRTTGLPSTLSIQSSGALSIQSPGAFSIQSPGTFSIQSSAAIQNVTPPTLHLRIVEKSLTTQHLLDTLETLLSLYIKVWLIEQGRFEDFVHYTHKRDQALEAEAPLPIAALTYNSPANIKFNLDISPKGVIDAVQTLVDMITHIQLHKQVAAEALRSQRIENDRKEEALKQDRLTTLEHAFGTLEQGIALVEKFSPHLSDEQRAIVVQGLATDILHLANDSTLKLSLVRPPSHQPLQTHAENISTKTP